MEAIVPEKPSDLRAVNVIPLRETQRREAAMRIRCVKICWVESIPQPGERQKATLFKVCVAG